MRGKTIRYDAAASTLRCGKHTVKLPGKAGRLKLRMIVDNCSIDVCAGDAGLFYMPMFFGPLESRDLALKVTGDPVTFNRLRVHELKSIW